MQYSQEHLKTMVYAEFGGQTECIMGNWKIENEHYFFARCPVDDTSELYSSPTGTFRFGLEAFEFVDQPFVFVHCHVIVCNATDPQSRCARGCEKKPRLRRQVQHQKIYSLAQGPITLDRNKEYKEPDNNLAIGSKVDTAGIIRSKYFS